MRKTTPKHLHRLSENKKVTNSLKFSRQNSDTDWQLAVATCELSWKKKLTTELLTLEENLDLLYQIIGVNYNTIIGKLQDTDHDDSLKYHEKLNESKQNYEATINEYLQQISSSTANLCVLLGVRTEFDLPIPVVVLLRLAAKICSIRWKDYKKRPNGLLKNYVYSLTPYLINISLTIFKTLVTILKTNIIPFIPFLNQTLFRILEWTRTSNLEKYNEGLYHSIRLQTFKVISFIVEQLSLNINLEPQLLKSALELELVGNIKRLLEETSDELLLKDRHIVEALKCLEHLVIVYSSLLEVQLEDCVKNFVIQMCIKIYRDFEFNTVSLICRRQLLQLLQVISNQPYATSTTEIAYHIFQLASEVETDLEMKSLARRVLKIGLAHRPTIVTHYDVYNSYSRNQLVIDQAEDEREEQQLAPMQVVDDSGNGRTEDLDRGQRQGEQPQIESMQNGYGKASSIEVIEEEQLEDSAQSQLPNGGIIEDEQVNDGGIEDDGSGEKTRSQVVDNPPLQTTEQAAEVITIEDTDLIMLQDDEEKKVESEILTYMNDFVDKLA